MVQTLVALESIVPTPRSDAFDSTTPRIETPAFELANRQPINPLTHQPINASTATASAIDPQRLAHPSPDPLISSTRRW